MTQLTHLQEALLLYVSDALRALPAAVARILLGFKAEPNVALFASVAEKVGAIIGSVALAVTIGDMARNSPTVAPYAVFIVIAVAFNAQHLATRIIAFSNPLIRAAEKRARSIAKKRFSDDDNAD